MMNVGKMLDLVLKYYQSGDLKRAEQMCKEILKNKPNTAEALHFLGVIYFQDGQHDLGIEHIKRALQIDPNFADAYNNLGNIFYDTGQLDEAILYYKKAARLSPQSARTYYNLGVSLQDKGQLGEAICHYRKALSLNFETFGLFNNLGLAVQEKGQLGEAITYYQKAVKLNPNFAEGYYNLANGLRDSGQLDTAISCYRKALSINPEYVDAYINLGIAYRSKGVFDKAVEQYRMVLNLKPENAEAHLNLSLALLLTGNFEEGWEKYEWRWKIKENSSLAYDLPRPSWDGASLEGKTLFVYTEQGIGDEIMFASCLPEIIDRAGLCIVACEKRLVPLFARSFPGAVVIEHFNKNNIYPGNLPPPDMKIAIGSLPKFLRPNLSCFPKHKSYLTPDARKVSLWRDRFASLGKGMKVGISWRGGRKLYDRLTRSIGLEQWGRLFSLTGVQYINLQYGDCKKELKEAEETFGVVIHDWEDSDSLKDLDSFASQIAALDLVISVDNATVHLAGALGLPVWTLLPFVPDWRWLLEREDSPWYPTMRLLRQPFRGDWESVMARVAGDLRDNLQ
jgi:tetratricopeptide (TPR) repeat protein